MMLGWRRYLSTDLRTATIRPFIVGRGQTNLAIWLYRNLTTDYRQVHSQCQLLVENYSL